MCYASHSHDEIYLDDVYLPNSHVRLCSDEFLSNIELGRAIYFVTMSYADSIPKFLFICDIANCFNRYS